MSWTCPHSGKTFELGICQGGRRVFKQTLREDVAERDDEPALTVEEMSWTCPHNGETFELGMCDGGRRVFNDKLRVAAAAGVAEAEAEKAVAGMRVGVAADSAAEALGATTLSGEAAPAASSAEIHIDSGSGPRVIALHNDGGAQLLLVAGQLTPPVTNGWCEGVEFLESRKKMTKEKAKKRIAEARHHLQPKR